MEGRPHTFANAGFEMEFYRPREKDFGLDICLTLRSSIPRLVPLFWGVKTI